MINPKAKWLFASLLILAILGVSLPLGFDYMTLDKDVFAFMRALSEISKDARRNGMGSTQRYALMDKNIEMHLAKIQSPSKLRDVFYACEEKTGFGYHNAQMQVLFRLADIRDDTSARILVGLLADETIIWDGERSLTIYEALVRCGDACMPGLSQITGEKHRLAEEAMSAIRGATATAPTTVPGS